MGFSISTDGITQRVLIILCLALFGVLARMFRIITEEARSSLAEITINITLPPLIFISMISNIKWERMVAGFIAPFLSFFLVVVGFLIAFLLASSISMTASRKGTFLILGSMPNTAFIGFPLIFAALGKEGLAYAVLYDIGVTIAFGSVAIFVLKGKLVAEERWKALINPPFLAVIAGLIVNKLGLKIPELILEPLKVMGSATIPLAMLLMGYMIAGIKIKLKSFNYELGLVCIFKLLIYPLLAYLVILPLKLDPLVQMVILIEAAMPSMASTPVLIQKYGGDEEFAASGTFLTTLLSIFTIPLIIHFFT